MEEKITLEFNNKIQEIIDEINKSIYDIPFGNSNFQNLAFMMASQITPERAYRALVMRLRDRISALKSVKFSKMKTEIDVEEKKYKIADEKTNVFEKRRLEIELMELEDSLPFQEKLINDTVHECNFLYNLFLKFPKYTREEFEKGEELHFIESAKRQMFGITGGKETLINITHDKEAFEHVFSKLAIAKPEQYHQLAFEMANKVFIDGSLGNPEDLPEHLKIGNNNEVSN